MMDKLVEEYIDRLENSIEKALRMESNINNRVLGLEGYSSSKTRHFLNNICSYNDTRYLEIGCWQGATLCSAISNNINLTAFGMDHFKEYDTVRQKKWNLYNNLKVYDTHKVVEFFESDSFEFDTQKIKDKINIYFYDGAHQRWAQEKAISYYLDKLDDIFILIVDDWNWEESVQYGTFDGIKNCNLKQHYFKQLKANFNGDKDNWWNGLGVFVLEKQ